ncbi:MAG: hypothetical protein PHI12_09795 [Dehalococcoidales bacterium]|nr:hypothetical protein [Dehalococcoidales bacterium]
MKFKVTFGHNTVPTEIEGDTIEDAIQSFHLDNLEYLRSIPGAASVTVEPGELDSPIRETWHFIVCKIESMGNVPVISRVCSTGIYRKGGMSSVYSTGKWQKAAGILGVPVDCICCDDWGDEEDYPGDETK